MSAKKNPALGGGRGGVVISNYSTADSIAPIYRLLHRLEGVREVGHGKWIARCPSHQDKSPSLSIRETSDGRVLVHDFAGCSAVEVLSAIGLGLTDLFERPVGHHLPKAKVSFPALPILKALSLEAGVVFVCGAALLAGEPFDFERLQVAIERIDAGLRVAEGQA